MLFAANDDNEKEDENKKDENTETYDYTLNDGDLLTDAKPVWKGTTSSIDPLFFNVMLPKIMIQNLWLMLCLLMTIIMGFLVRAN